MPISAQKSRGMPRLHTLRPIIVPSVSAATTKCGKCSGCGMPMPSRLRNATLPSATAISTTTSPEISGGRYGRNGRSRRESAASIRPANASIPNASDTPPVLTARNDGARYAAVHTGGHRYPAPRPPRGRLWSTAPSPRMSMVAARTSEVWSNERPASRLRRSGYTRTMAMIPTCCRPLNTVTASGGRSSAA